MSTDANDLFLFARVVEAGSFSGAAARLRLPKSTVSRRVAALEKRLGERLLLRSTRQLKLTEFGEGVLDHARALAGEVDGALALALHRQARPSGRLKVSMPADFASIALERMLADFVRAHPAITLELDLSPRRVDLVGEGFDLAIRMGDLGDDSQLTARRLASFSGGLYAAPDFVRRHGELLQPEALASVHGLMVLNRHGEAVPWTLVSDDPAGVARWSGLPASHTLANSPELLLRLARCGAGVALAADFFAAPYLERGELQRLLPRWRLAPPGPAWAVFPGRRLMPARTRVFIEAMATALASCTLTEAPAR